MDSFFSPTQQRQTPVHNDINDDGISPLTISFDIGIKNLAYCLFYPIDASQECIQIIDWRIINLLETDEKPVRQLCNCINRTKSKQATQCGKPAIYRHTDSYYCGVHAKTCGKQIPSKANSLASFKKLKIDELRDRIQIHGIPTTGTKTEILQKVEQWLSVELLEPVDAPEKKNAKKTHLVELGTAMKRRFREYLSPYMNRIKSVLLENQISPIAGRMNTIQGLVAQTFIMMKEDGETIDIEFVSSSGKLKKYKNELAGETNNNELSLQQQQNQNYKQHKKDSIRITQEKIIANPEMTCWQSMFEKSSKKDDLADCYLQALYKGRI